MATAAPPDEAAPPGRTSADRRRNLARAGAVVIGLGIVLLWLYAFAQARVTPHDKLDDAAFAQRAQPICQAGVDALAALPPAYEMPDAGARADVIDRSDDLLRQMLDQLRAARPTEARDAGMVDEWLVDWETYLGDRARYAQALRQDPGARFNVTAKSQDQITEPVDRFAKVNGMDACTTPQDLG